jgi:hypothetical protein
LSRDDGREVDADGGGAGKIITTVAVVRTLRHAADVATGLEADAFALDRDARGWVRRLWLERLAVEVAVAGRRAQAASRAFAAKLRARSAKTDQALRAVVVQLTSRTEQTVPSPWKVRGLFLGGRSSGEQEQQRDERQPATLLHGASTVRRAGPGTALA